VCEVCDMDIISRAPEIVYQYNVVTHYKHGEPVVVTVLATAADVDSGCLLLFNEGALVTAFASGAWLSVDAKPCLPQKARLKTTEPEVVYCDE